MVDVFLVVRLDELNSISRSRLLIIDNALAP